MAFVNDAASEAALQQGLVELQGVVDIHRGGIKAAIVAMQRMATPRVLIVDVSAEDSPLDSLQTLSDVVEPHVCVLVIGDLTSLDFYRELTRNVGAAEYLTKPLSRELVARHFAPKAHGRAATGEAALGGRIITVTGVQGGVGATTVAMNLAWHFGIDVRRHTVLLDPDTQFGTASFLLNVEPGAGLATALQNPDRIDTLLAERAAHPVDDRLHLLAGLEPIDTPPNHAPEAAAKLLAALRRRYTFIVADVPMRPLPLYQDLFQAAHRRVLVLDPTLVAVRDALRLMAIPTSSAEQAQPVLVLNRLGRAGGLGQRAVEDALQRAVDVVIPDLPKALGRAAIFGKPAISASSGFRDAIVELSRQVAFSRLLDTANFSATAISPRKGRLGRLLGLKS
jgi:pilus assembly protein CpaE